MWGPMSGECIICWDSKTLEYDKSHILKQPAIMNAIQVFISVCLFNEALSSLGYVGPVV
jgi:hypothetical protein